MGLRKDFHEKPLEFSSAFVLIILGIGLSFLNFTGAGAIGTLAAALGGALLSYCASSINERIRAAQILAPELQAASRHLADTASKLSRNIQNYQSGRLDSELAIDRITQLTTSIYGSVNDLDIVAGSSPSYQTLLDTVSNCEQMASRLEELTQGGVTSNEAEEMQHQLESMRLQLNTVRKSLGDIDVQKKEERVQCPGCNGFVIARLGLSTGDSATATCASCSCRFHIHRGAGGKTFTRAWGGSTDKQYIDSHVEATCPKCKTAVPLKFDLTNTSEKRFCMTCCSDLQIAKDGTVLQYDEATPVSAPVVGHSGYKQLLQCPTCGVAALTIWRNQKVARAVCKTCNLLLETSLRTEPTDNGKPSSDADVASSRSEGL